MLTTTTTYRRPAAQLQRTRIYSLTGQVGRKLQEAHALQQRIATLTADLTEIRQQLLAHMEANRLDRMEAGDVRVSRKVRHDWSYSPELARELLHLRQAQKWEQLQGIATDSPTVYCALTTISTLPERVPS